MRLIDADKLITAFCGHCEAMICVAPGERVCIDGGDCFDKKLIENAPTIEAVPVVRCRDCKYGQYEEWDNGECVDKTVYCDEYGFHKPDWFCADEERKDEDATEGNDEHD